MHNLNIRLSLYSLKNTEIMSRISYRNWPVLKMLKDGSLFERAFIHPTFKEEYLSRKDKVSLVMGELRPLTHGKVFHESDAFHKAKYAASKQLSKALEAQQGETQSLVALIDHVNGILILSKSIRDNTKEAICFTALYYPSGELMQSGVVWFEVKDGGTTVKANAFPHILGHASLVEASQSAIFSDLFRKYASVEIVESKARTKIHAQGCKYLNETDLDIEYLDSKWFTSLVNSKGFKVRGFFRLQPKKKDGEWVKELIWIEDFEKKGYNRKAGILK